MPTTSIIFLLILQILILLVEVNTAAKTLETSSDHNGNGRKPWVTKNKNNPPNSDIRANGYHFGKTAAHIVGNALQYILLPAIGTTLQIMFPVNTAATVARILVPVSIAASQSGLPYKQSVKNNKVYAANPADAVASGFGQLSIMEKPSGSCETKGVKILHVVSISDIFKCECKVTPGRLMGRKLSWNCVRLREEERYA